ncbi:hypothetical protein LCGC14_0883930 [marine sediment metagenome]|uniref:Uncharacterized protein n=1 Tax=marine sediment metagenome TaxID=412755 RepID=A0A0F9RKM4_9ZZZZ
MSIQRLDLKNDLSEVMKQYLKELEGLSPDLDYYSQVKSESDPNKLCLLYYNLTNRLVELRPRKVHFSSVFYCPTRFKDALDSLIEKIRSGEDINPYLSKRIRWVVGTKKRRNRHRDVLLDSWGIKHIHLETNIESNGFVERSGPILFVKFDDENAYFLLIKRHGRRTKKNGKKSKRLHSPWNRQILIDILHNNWSDSIQNFKTKLEFEASSDDEIKQWWRGNINVLTKSKDGTGYFSPGVGVATSGDNIQNVRICQHIFRYLDNVEEFFQENINNLIETMEQNGKKVDEPLEFELLSFEFIGLKLKIEVFEVNTQFMFDFEEGKQPLLHFEIN